jgi:hypothetical protein
MQSEPLTIQEMLDRFRNDGSCEKAIIERLQKAEEALAEEKECRIGYQDTVYEVCLELDKTLGNSPSKGQAVGSSKAEVLEALQKVTRRPCLKCGNRARYQGRALCEECQVKAIFNGINSLISGEGEQDDADRK